jgi:hypothetical protein
MAEDKRKAVELSQADKEVFLSEMNALLKAIQQIVSAVDKKDMKAVAAAASESRKRIPLNSKELLKSLPPNFKVFADSVQQGFAKIEESALSGTGNEKIISLLGDQLGRCVTCHAVFRLK